MAFASLYNGDNITGLSDEPWYKRINDQHFRGVESAIGHYESNGWTVLETEVLVRVPGFKFPRIYDFIAEASGQIFGVEVKTTVGDAITLDSLQVAKDVTVITSGGSIISGAFAGVNISGVGYVGTCFGCQTLYANSKTLYRTLQAARIPVNRCDAPAGCNIGTK